MASGTISFTDVDLTDRPVASAAFTSFTYRARGIDANLRSRPGNCGNRAVHAPLTVMQAAGNTNNGSASWSYSVPDSAFDFLADGEILTLTYTATVDDGHGGIITKPFTVTVTGSNDAVVITSAPQTARSPKSPAPTIRRRRIRPVARSSSPMSIWTDTHAVTIAGVAHPASMTGLANGDIQLGWLTLGALDRFHRRRSRLAGMDVLGPGSLFRLSCR